MNYFYILDDKYIIGYSVTDDISELEKTVPAYCKIYLYKPGDNLEDIARKNVPVGTGKGQTVVL